MWPHSVDLDDLRPMATASIAEHQRLIVGLHEPVETSEKDEKAMRRLEKATYPQEKRFVPDNLVYILFLQAITRVLTGTELR